MFKLSRLSIVSAVLLLALVFVGCQAPAAQQQPAKEAAPAKQEQAKEASGAKQNSAPAAKQESAAAAKTGSGKKEIVIGYSAELTGKFNVEANDMNRGYQLWAEEVNNNGGILVKDLGKKLPVRLLVYDDNSDTNNAIKNYEKLITGDKVDLVFSTWGSAPNFAITPTTEKYKYPVIASSGAADNIFTRGFKYVFQTAPLTSHLLNVLVDYLSSNKEIKTAAIAYENFLFTQSLHDSIKPKLEAAGIKVVVDEQYPLGNQDFKAILAKVSSAKPDAFILLNIMPTSVYATKQLAESGYAPKVYFTNIGPMFLDEFVKPLGKAAENTLEAGHWDENLPFKGAKEFAQDFDKKYSRHWSTDAAYAYIAGQILQQAIEKAGTLDREKINQVLHSEKFDTILGPYKYDQNGVSNNTVTFLAQTQDGARKIVWPKDIANATLRYPFK